LVERDPWDRIIAAQAIRRGLTVISIDDAFDKLGAPRLW
jgi:PIN domain nuclease of toxin-antitoxin system